MPDVIAVLISAHFLSVFEQSYPSPPPPIPQPRSGPQEPTPNIYPHPQTDIQIWGRNGSSNPDPGSSKLEPWL